MAASTVTVVICAYTMERIDDIRSALKSVHEQSLTADQVILVADHNSELAAIIASEFPWITVLENRHSRGLSGARNTAIEQATGDVVAFLDDDARAADREWLATLLAPYSDPNVIAVGGAAQPVWPDDRPAFLPRELDWIVGCTYEGQPTQQADVRNLMGCNMSFRRDVFDVVGVFTDGLGRIGKTPLGCEETELCIRAQQAIPGARIVFDPTALVRHRVSDDRVTWKYLVKRSYAEGLSKAVVSSMVGADDATSAERSYATKVLPRGVVRQLRQGVKAPAELSGAAGIVTALAVTVGGYARGRMSTMTSKKPVS